MEVEEDGGYCTLSPSAEVMLQRGRREGGLCHKSTNWAGRDWIRTGINFFKDLSLKLDASGRDCVRTFFQLMHH